MTAPYTYLLTVTGMSCQHCAQAITQGVLDQDAQAQVTIDVDTGATSVTTILSEDAVREIIRTEGYGVA